MAPTCVWSLTVSIDFLLLSSHLIYAPELIVNTQFKEGIVIDIYVWILLLGMVD